MVNKKKYKERITISLTMEKEHKDKIERKGQLTDWINKAITEKLKRSAKDETTKEI